MVEAVPHVTHAWEGFYVIVGTSAGALVGLQFVVITLITEAGVVRGSTDTLAAFGSPNVVHFSMALLLSALFAAPWHDLPTAGLAVALVGLGGLVYSFVVLRRALRQRDYKPVLEDWVWHAALPTAAYVALVFAGYELGRNVERALCVVAGSTLLLVFIGIHNAWDTVMYVVADRTRQAKARAAGSGAGGAASRAPGDEGPEGQGI